MQRQLSYALNSINSACIEIVAAVVPWLAPIPPAYLVYRASLSNFALPPPVAFCLAALVEGAGMLAIDTAQRIKFYSANRRKSDPEPAVNGMGWMIAAYILLVLAITVLTDVMPGLSRWSIMFVLPIVVLVYQANSIRMQQNRIEARNDTAKRAPPRVPDTTLSEVNAKRQSGRDKRLSQMRTIVTRTPDISRDELAERFNVSVRTVMRDLSDLRQPVLNGRSEEEL